MSNRQEYYIKNREKILAYKRKYYLKNKERILKYKKEHYNGSNYYEINKEKILKKVREYQELKFGKRYPKKKKSTIKKNKNVIKKQKQKKSPEEIKEQRRLYREKNREILREKNRQYRERNRETIRERKRRYNKHKRKTDLKCNLNYKMSTAIRKSLHKSNKAGKHWETLVGYNVNDLMRRLKKTMPEGYTWNNYLEGKLHIDHIIPLSAFHFDKVEHPDFKKCWALKNLQLLPARENLIKGSKLSKPFQPALKLFLIS